MDRLKLHNYLTNYLIVGMAIAFLYGCNSGNDKKYHTEVSIAGNKWHFNNEVINPGSPAEGLLMNVRMVNAVFEDRGPELEKQNPDFDPAENTSEFIRAVPEYVSNGVNAFTISLQGGLPGYEGAVNTAFNSDGSLKPEYFERMEKVVKACDANHAAVILTLFYQRQHSHESALSGKDAIFKAMENTVNWISEKEFTNVVLEISNEYRHGGYRNWPDGEWLRSEEGQVELMERAKELNPALLVSTSGMGNGLYHEDLARTADFLLIHFNNTSLEDYQEKIDALKKYNKPIVCNEDDKIKQEGAIALALSVLNGSGWGYMNIKVNQHIPFDFSGVEDDTAVYSMFKAVATPGYNINPEALKQTSIIITSPNDGDIFSLGETVSIELSHLYPNRSVPYTIELLANNKPVATVGQKLQVNWQPEEPGVVVFEAVVKDDSGEEIYRSPKMDIIVQPEK
ncbi:MAG: cellulase family glycosylhydrolase [Bacteroidota bacterium]